MARRLTTYILIGMLLGIVAGFVVNQAAASAEQAKEIASYFKVVTDIFLRLIKMIIAPLVFATLVSGIAHMGDSAALGRIGVKTIGWFIGASLVSLSLGLMLVHVFAPGVGVGLELPEATAASGVQTVAPSLSNFITHIVPKSFFEAMATNEILQIVVFSVFTGVALTAIGEKGKILVRGVEALTQLMLQITDYVMRTAPVAVFAAIAAAVGTHGLGIIFTFGKFIGGFYAALGVLWAVLLAAAVLVLGAKRGLMLPRYIREPILLAFSTASSEAAFPKTLEQLERFGIPNRIAGFVLPLGYSFNLDGSMMYMTFGVMFIAQAYGVELTIAQQITMLLLLMVTSKGMAAVPRASLVVIAATLQFFSLPEGGLLLILAIDQFLDMGRSGTNVVGNAVATAVVAKWEGLLQPPLPPEMEPPPAPAHTAARGAAGMTLDPEIIEDVRTP
jgi:Na+/H+-dicarboxylate symporter